MSAGMSLGIKIGLGTMMLLLAFRNETVRS
jgi:hypothetical protein